MSHRNKQKLQKKCKQQLHYTNVFFTQCNNLKWPLNNQFILRQHHTITYKHDIQSVIVKPVKDENILAAYLCRISFL